MNTYKTYQKGLTLIELMIAMAISVTLLGGLIEVYLGSKQSYNLAEESSRLQENGRFSIDIMTREIRGADFWGCLRSPQLYDAGTGEGNIFNSLNTGSAAYDANIHALGDGIAGTDGGGSNSDSITLGSAFNAGIDVEADPGAGAVIQAAADNGLQQNDIVIVSNCTGGDVFQVTGANPGGSGSVGHNTGNVSAGPGNSKSNAPAAQTGPCAAGVKHCLSQKYADGATIYKVSGSTYDIRPSTTSESGANGLFRNGVEIIENVENMQILYGIDTDADASHTPNQYVVGAGSMPTAVTVRLALLLRGERDLLPTTTAQTHQILDASIATNDRRLYRTFTTTITVRNRALIDPP